MRIFRDLQRAVILLTSIAPKQVFSFFFFLLRLAFNVHSVDECDKVLIIIEIAAKKSCADIFLPFQMQIVGKSIIFIYFSRLLLIIRNNDEILSRKERRIEKRIKELSWIIVRRQKIKYSRHVYSPTYFLRMGGIEWNEINCVIFFGTACVCL